MQLNRLGAGAKVLSEILKEPELDVGNPPNRVELRPFD
jgi:hypothetical protein